MESIWPPGTLSSMSCSYCRVRISLDVTKGFVVIVKFCYVNRALPLYLLTINRPMKIRKSTWKDKDIKEVSLLLYYLCACFYSLHFSLVLELAESFVLFLLESYFISTNYLSLLVRPPALPVLLKQVHKKEVKKRKLEESLGLAWNVAAVMVFIFVIDILWWIVTLIIYKKIVNGTLWNHYIAFLYVIIAV